MLQSRGILLPLAMSAGVAEAGPEEWLLGEESIAVELVPHGCSGERHGAAPTLKEVGTQKRAF